MEALENLLLGALILGCALVALFFVRFFRDTRDRLFAFFAAAFLVLAFHWLVLALTDPVSEHRPLFYLLRLVAFGMIVVAILEKNRERR
jgi:hypothetical protein